MVMMMVVMIPMLVACTVRDLRHRRKVVIVEFEPVAELTSIGM